MGQVPRGTQYIVYTSLSGLKIIMLGRLCIKARREQLHDWPKEARHVTENVNTPPRRLVPDWHAVPTACSRLALAALQLLSAHIAWSQHGKAEPRRLRLGAIPLFGALRLGVSYCGGRPVSLTGSGSLHNIPSLFMPCLVPQDGASPMASPCIKFISRDCNEGCLRKLIEGGVAVMLY
jgi:hypothetical protein